MKQWRDDIKRFFATYFMINYETGMLEWIDGGEVKTRDDAYGNPMIRYGTRDYYVKYVIWFLHHEVQATKKDIFIHATSPNATLKTAVTAEWFERNKAELGYW